MVLIPMFLRKVKGNKNINKIPTTFKSVSCGISRRIFPPITPHTIAIAHSGMEYFRMIFFSFRNLAIEPMLNPIAPSLLVANAICGGNPKNMSAGMEINPHHPEIAPTNAAMIPMKNASTISMCVVNLKKSPR